MNEFKNYSELRFNLELLPTNVALDIMSRISDWLISGGTIEDSYIKKQLEFASEFIQNNRG